MVEKQQVLEELWSVIDQRAREPDEKSYTCKLLAGGVEAIGAKVVEEAAELVEAAEEVQDATDSLTTEARDHLCHEAGDLIYHMLVLLRHGGVTLAEVEAKLAARFGIGGLEEKASRKN